MLLAAVHDGDVRGDQNIVFDRDAAERAAGSDVNVATNLGRRVGEDRSESDARSLAAAVQGQPVKRPTQVLAGESWNQTEKLRPAGKRAVLSSDQGCQSVDHKRREHEQRREGVSSLFEESFHRLCSGTTNKVTDTSGVPSQISATEMDMPRSTSLATGRSWMSAATSRGLAARHTLLARPYRPAH